MSITSRPYTDDDLPLLQAALAAWIQAAGDCGYCHVGELVYRIYTNFQDSIPATDLVQIWEDKSGIMGFTINLRFDNSFEVYVSPQYRGTDDELMLLQTASHMARQFMQQIGREGKTVIIDVWDGDMTRINLLHQLGYEQYKVWGYYQACSLFVAIPQPVLPDGFTIHGATLDDIEQLAAVHNGAFGSNWEAEEYRDALMLKPGYDPQREIVVVAPDGRFAAFTIMWLDDVNKVGLFEPVGTHKDFQRRGLARALMLHCLHKMKHLGMETAMVGHDAENLAASRLYQSIGFTKKYATLGFKRE